MSDCYPSEERKRSGYFARFAKAIFRSGAVLHHGSDAVMLSLLVASREDRLHYNKPPMIWRGELMEQLGIGSPKRILAARQAAEKAGLLKYVEGTRTKPPSYWTLTPDWLVPFMRHVPKRNASGSTRSETEHETERVAERETERILEPSTQDPPKGKRVASLSPEFEAFWKAYPPRNGKRLGKTEAAKAFAKIASQDHPELMRAVSLYRATCGDFAKDASRFLKGDFWRDVLEVTTTTTTTISKPAAPMQRGKRQDLPGGTK